MAVYRICELDCTLEQKQNIMERLHNDYDRRFRIHYAVCSLPFIVMGIPFYLKNQYTCSSYIAKVLQENGIAVSNKHFSIVTPKDLFGYKEMKVVFEGFLSEIAADRLNHVPERVSVYE